MGQAGVEAIGLANDPAEIRLGGNVIRHLGTYTIVGGSQRQTGEAQRDPRSLQDPDRLRRTAILGRLAEPHWIELAWGYLIKTEAFHV
jgi:hypothetical protein